MSLTGLKGVLFLANYGSDPTEAAIPWEVLTEAGVEFDVATENGQVRSRLASLKMMSNFRVSDSSR